MVSLNITESSVIPYLLCPYIAHMVTECLQLYSQLSGLHYMLCMQEPPDLIPVLHDRPLAPALPGVAPENCWVWPPQMDKISSWIYPRFSANIFPVPVLPNPQLASFLTPSSPVTFANLYSSCSWILTSFKNKYHHPLKYFPFRGAGFL